MLSLMGEEGASLFSTDGTLRNHCADKMDPR